MLKEEQMTMRLPGEIKAEFQQAADIADRSAAQISREFMRDFVTQNKTSAVLISPCSTVEERQAAMRFGRASIAPEGFAVSSEAQAQQERWVRREITIEECIAGIKQAHQGA